MRTLRANGTVNNAQPALQTRALHDLDRLGRLLQQLVGLRIGQLLPALRTHLVLERSELISGGIGVPSLQRAHARLAFRRASNLAGRNVSEA
jgi:hypothetical protein